MITGLTWSDARASDALPDQEVARSDRPITTAARSAVNDGADPHPLADNPKHRMLTVVVGGGDPQWVQALMPAAVGGPAH
jgi:hypothetical protein